MNLEFPKLTDVWLQGLVQAHIYVESWINPLRFTLAVILNLFWKVKEQNAQKYQEKEFEYLQFETNPP